MDQDGATFDRTRGADTLGMTEAFDKRAREVILERSRHLLVRVSRNSKGTNSKLEFRLSTKLIRIGDPPAGVYCVGLRGDYSRRWREGRRGRTAELSQEEIMISGWTKPRHLLDDQTQSQIAFDAALQPIDSAEMTFQDPWDAASQFDPLFSVSSDPLLRQPDDVAGALMELMNPSQALLPFNRRSHGPDFSQLNLVSDSQAGHLNAQMQDPNLINPWGVAFSRTGSPFWVNNNHTGTATVYNVDPKTNATTTIPLVVTIATPQAVSGVATASPTGIVFNSDQSGFIVNGKPALFIMDTEDGTISAWNGGTTTTLVVDNSANSADGDPNVQPGEGVGAVYKGLAIGTLKNGTTLLYATNFRHGTVDVFNSQWQQVNSLTDGDLPAGYAPFNVQALKGDLFVSYAQQDAFKHDDVAGQGHGYIDEFSLSGKLVARVASNGPLDSPWGMAIAPKDFGKFAGDLLVGNFGDGTIDAYNLNNDKFVGKLDGVDGKPIVIGDLWALTPGNGGSAGSTGEIYFTSGVQAESSGLFGAIAPVAGHGNAFMVT